MQPDNDTTEKVTQPRETVSTTFQLPYDVWRALRNAATDRAVSQQQIHIEALRQYLGVPDPTKPPEKALSTAQTKRSETARSTAPSARDHVMQHPDLTVQPQ